MKAGLLTFYSSLNYGALLQAYALQRTVKKIGTMCDIIPYICPSIENEVVNRKITECKSIKNIIAMFIINYGNNKKRRLFNHFLNEYMKCDTKTRLLRNELSELASEYDFFISGSDQVWNYKITNGDPVYFMDFVKDSKKKITYAPSFGMNKIGDPIYKEKFRKLILSIGNLSVRENEGRDIVKELIGVEPQIVLDPTFLLDDKEWREIAIAPKIKHPYILLYEMAPNAQLIEFCRQKASDTGYHIIRINAPLINYKILPAVTKPLRYIGPREFLGYFSNADYVITNSFHGTAFSINFHKQFCVFSYGLSERDGRIKNLLESVGLLQYFNPVKCSSDIKWEAVDSKMEQLKKKSMTFLQDALK